MFILKGYIIVPKSPIATPLQTGEKKESYIELVSEYRDV